MTDLIVNLLLIISLTPFGWLFLILGLVWLGCKLGDAIQREDK
jgi:hypothetical protein